MAKRRERGEGSISGPRSDGSFEVRISLGVTDGKRRRVKARVRGTRADARAKLDELRDTYSLTAPGTKPPTLEKYLQSWIARRRPSLAPATIRMYEGAIANLTPFLGHLRLDRLTPEQISIGLRALATRKLIPLPAAEGEPKRFRKAGADGTRTVQAAYDTLRAALTFAVRKDQLLRFSPITAVARPRLDREIDFLNRDEARAFLKAAATDRYRALWHLVIATGLRWGEVAGLRWSDIDLSNGSLTIRRALKETRDLGPTKSRGGRRRIDLPASVIAELERHRKKTAQAEHLVFRTRNGEPLHASNFARRHLFPILERAKLRRIRFHDLRHTAAAIRMLAGQHPLVVKELLGHASIRTTLDVYGHLQNSVSKDAAAEFDRVMSDQGATAT